MATAKKHTFFLNLYANDLDAAVAFYKALNFKYLPDWCLSGTAAALSLPAPNDNITLMLLTPTAMSEYIRPGTTVGDATKATHAIFTILAQSNEDVDEIMAKADKAGAKLDPYVMKDYGAEHGMYSRSFEDLSGHIWEAVRMPGPSSSQS